MRLRGLFLLVLARSVCSPQAPPLPSHYALAMPPLPDSTPSPLSLKQRLSFRAKSAYGMGTALEMWGFWLYPGVAYGVFNIFLKVDPRYVGLALMLIRIFDAFSDPICGWLSDNTRSRFGRRRPYILGAGIASGVMLPVLFAVSPDWGGSQFMGLPVLFLWMLLTNLVYIPIISAFSMPFNSLGAEMSPDYNERTSVMTYRSAMQKLFEVGNFYALRFTNLSWFMLPAIVTENGETIQQKDTLLGIQVYTLILGAIMVVFAIYMFTTLKERYYHVVEERQKKITFWDSFRGTLGCKPYRIMLWFGLAFSIANSMVGGLGYYCTVYYVCGGDSVKGDNWNFYMGLGYMALGFLGPQVLSLVSKRYGKKTAIITACCVGIASFAGTWVLYNPAAPYLQVLASGMIAFSCSAIWMLHSAIGADIVDYDELHTGQRREGGFASFGSWILKFGNALGQGATGFILAYVGFDAAKTAQSAETIFGIRFMLAAIPVVGLIAAIGFALTFPLSKAKVLEIRQELEERRGTV